MQESMGELDFRLNGEFSTPMLLNDGGDRLENTAGAPRYALFYSAFVPAGALGLWA